MVRATAAAAASFSSRMILDSGTARQYGEGGAFARVKLFGTAKLHGGRLVELRASVNRTGVGPRRRISTVSAHGTRMEHGFPKETFQVKLRVANDNALVSSP